MQSKAQAEEVVGRDIGQCWGKGVSRAERKCLQREGSSFIKEILLMCSKSHAITPDTFGYNNWVNKRNSGRFDTSQENKVNRDFGWFKNLARFWLA